MILKRKIYDQLVEWKELANGTSAILVGGAGRIVITVTVLESVFRMILF